MLQMRELCFQWLNSSPKTMSGVRIHTGDPSFGDWAVSTLPGSPGADEHTL